MADTQKQIIEVQYVATQAQKDAAKFAADEQKRTKQTADVAKKAAKEEEAARKAALKAMETYGKHYNDQVKADQKKALESAKQTAKDLTAAEKAEAAKREDAQKIADRLILKEYRDRIAQQIRETRRLAAEEKKATLEAHAAREKAATAAAKQWSAADTAMMGSIKSIGMFTGAMIGMNSASTIMATIAERFQKIRDASIEGAQRMLNQASGMRSLSAVVNQTGQPSMTHVDILRMTAKTMQTPEAAAAMMQAAMGKGFGAIQGGLVTDKEFQKAGEYQGKRQTLYNESPEAMGMILGMLPMMSERKGQTAEELEALNQRLDEIRKLAGFTNYAQAVGQVERVSPYVLKGIYSGPMAMALTGAMAMGGKPEEAGTHLEQATTAVTIGMMRNRRMKVLPEDQKQYETTAEYFKTLKDASGKAVTDQMPAEERLLAVVNDVMKAEDAALRAGKHFEGTFYLGEKGFINQEHMLALTSLVGVHRKGLLSQMIQAGRAPITPHVAGQGVDADFAKLAMDPAGADLFAQRESEIAEEAAFAKDRFRTIESRKAFNRLGGKGKFGEDVPDILKRMSYDPYEFMFRPRHEIEMEAQNQILTAAVKAGVQLPDDRHFGTLEGMKSEIAKSGKVSSFGFAGWDKLFDIAQQTGAKGGNILSGPDQAAMARNLQIIADNTSKMTGGQPAVVGAPAAAKPVMAPPVAHPIPGPANRGAARNAGAAPWF